ncbi:hypothetical protein [Sulfitobacter noctilucicola]|nr:hypothetical protein [Sulfitobacter noctilucicola]
MLYMLAEFGALQAIFTGALIGLILGFILSLFICRSSTAANDLNAEEKPAQRYAREAEEKKASRVASSGATTGAASHNTSAEAATGGASAATPATAGTTAANTDTAANTKAAKPAQAADTSSANTTAAPLMSGGIKPSAPLAGQAELASRKGEWKYEAKKDTGAKVNKAKAMPAGETVAPAVAPDADAVDGATIAKEPTSKSKPKRAPVAADGKPELFETAPADGGDDLKLISGVGPKLEQTLNEMGIYRFEQVAAWRKKEIEWVDSRLRFKGRIERDNWMSQAKILAKGGETEFSKRKKK